MSKRRHQRPHAGTILSLALLLGTGGCNLYRLQQDLKTLDTVVQVSGKVGTTFERDPDSKIPIVVVLYDASGDSPEIVDYTVLARPGPFKIHTFPGTYGLFAFEDHSRDFAFQKGEPWGHWLSDPPLTLAAGDEFLTAELILQSIPPTRPITVDLMETHGSEQLTRHQKSLGRVMSLDNERFEFKNGPVGLWQPATFALNGWAGIYFLQEYDADKIPVLFVHGVSGTPRNFATIIEHLDQSRFQPWVAFYPSGLHLEDISHFFSRRLTELEARLRFDKIFIVAHSVGGLVSRSLVQQHAELTDAKDLQLLVTIATPWNGIPAAATGAARSPTKVPNWIELSPDSEFLTQLRETPLPDEIDHHLLFAFSGGSMFSGEPNDGTVTLSSQLQVDVQAQATSRFGFHEDHVAVLAAEAPVAQVVRILTEQLDRD